jgi:hypothetical protein
VKGGKIHSKMILLSDWSNHDENDNLLECIKSKLKVVYLPPAVSFPMISKLESAVTLWSSSRLYLASSHPVLSPS